MTSPNPTDTYTQYSNAKQFFSSQNAPSWIGPNTDDQDRVRAYILYERLYWNVPNTMITVQRGEDAQPVYLPSARKIVEACNRFLEVGWDYSVDTTAGNTSDQTTVDALFKTLFKRECVYAKHARQKRYGLIRGDHVWHVTADDTLPAGQRISIHEVAPEQCFAILENQNPDWIIGYHLVDLVPDPRDETKQVCRRQTYLKTTGSYIGPSTISSSVGLYELGKWDDRVAPSNVTPIVEPVGSPIVPEFILPDDITTLPVYLMPNQKMPCTTYGSSEIRGIETIIASINQTATDEDLTLATQGLGVYATSAGPPVDSNGVPGTFDIGPSRVVEVPSGETFERVSGVQSGLPGIEHMTFILGQMQSAQGVPDIAAGVVDVTVAESGIALQLQLAPLLSHNKEKETEDLGIETQWFDDLVNGWFVAYEGFGRGTGVVVTPTVQNPVPQDRAARFNEIIEMVTAVPPVMSVRTAIVELNKIGYNIPSDELTQLQKEATDRAAVAPVPAVDPFGARASAELGGAPGPKPPTVPPVGAPKPVNGVSKRVGAPAA